MESLVSFSAYQSRNYLFIIFPRRGSFIHWNYPSFERLRLSLILRERQGGITIKSDFLTALPASNFSHVTHNVWFICLCECFAPYVSAIDFSVLCTLPTVKNTFIREFWGSIIIRLFFGIGKIEGDVARRLCLLDAKIRGRFQMHRSLRIYSHVTFLSFRNSKISKHGIKFQNKND